MAVLSRLTDYEFHLKKEINGLPIIHINIGADPATGRPRVAKGIVAIGNVAFGIVSIGAAAFGIVTLAGFGFGVVSLAGLAVGIVALGGMALGYDVALGAVVESANYAAGAIRLDLHSAVWSIIFAAVIVAVIWGLRKFKAD